MPPLPTAMISSISLLNLKMGGGGGILKTTPKLRYDVLLNAVIHVCDKFLHNSYFPQFSIYKATK